MKITYLDNNATTKVAPEVIEAMLPFFTDLWGNASSIHSFGGRVGKHIDCAREQVAKLINAEISEIIFTSSGSESDNTALHSATAAAPSKKRIVTTNVEHPAVLNVAKEYEKRGYEVIYLPVDGKGQISIEELESKLTSDTAIVSIMWANNETGTLFPIEEIAKLCAAKKIPLHVDAVQAVGKIPIDLKKIPITFLSISGHKLHAPKGVGALFVRRGTPFIPFILGGHQEKGRRAGTENSASIVGFGKACELAQKNIDQEVTEVARLRDRLEDGILRDIPKSLINGDSANRLPNTTNIGFEGIEGEAILLMLNEFGICASSGSACTTGSLEPSHVLMAMGIPFTRAHGSIRFSLSRYTTAGEIDLVLEKMPGIIKRLREISPFS